MEITPAEIEKIVRTEINNHLVTHVPVNDKRDRIDILVENCGKLISARITENETKLKKEVNHLVLEKVACFGFIDSILETLPRVKREQYLNQIARFKFIKNIDLAKELPYENI